MFFSRLTAVLVAFTFFVGISQCTAVCAQAEVTIQKDLPPCHDMGHAPSRPDHSSCNRPLLIAEQAGSIQTPAVHLHVEALAAPHGSATLIRSSFVRAETRIVYPPRPPRSTTVLLL
jgi:hypothetical protein